MSLSALIRVRGVETSRQFPEGHPLAGRWEGVDLADEFAALVEAYDAMQAALVRWADANDAARRANLFLGMNDKDADREYREAGDALLRVARTERTARAALVAKITTSP